MRAIDASTRMIHLATQVISELGITADSLTDLASKLKSTFLIEVPDNTEVYLKGTTLKRIQTTFAEAARSSSDFDYDAPIKVDPTIGFLCLDASDCEAIVQRGALRKKQFECVALFNSETGTTCLYPTDYAKQFLPNQERVIYITGSFQTFQRGDVSIEKSIIIRFENILISTQALRAIRQELKNKEPDYGKFQKGGWTSPKLAQLNEASTLFFSQNHNSRSELSIETKEEIKVWFRAHWGAETGVDLIEQAINAILPARFYPKAPPKETISTPLRSEYNDYASTTLILINEAAKHFWQATQEKNHKTQDKRIEIIRVLQSSEWGFTARLATAAATIISLKTRSQ